MFYSGRKWLPFMRKVGAQRSWFDWHVWAGAIGPVLVLMHTADAYEEDHDRAWELVTEIGRAHV
mgnify:CR=1 FL=1